MQCTIEPLEGNKVKLDVSVDETSFDQDIEVAYRKLARQVRIPGFRPGKAPRRVIEAHLGDDGRRPVGHAAIRWWAVGLLWVFGMRVRRTGTPLSPDASTRQTLDTTSAISRALADKEAFPELASAAVYMGDGGPRFILALNPPTPAAHRAYAVLTLAPGATHAADPERSQPVFARRDHCRLFQAEPAAAGLGSGG